MTNLTDNNIYDQKMRSERNLLRVFIENAGYKLIKIISNGVYLAIDANGKKYVVKNYREIGLDGFPTYDNPEKCIRVLNSIKHENIQKLHRVFEFNDSWSKLLITDYVQGITLARYLYKNPLEKEEIFTILGQIIDAVSYLHSKGVVHRDLTPANIIWDGNKATIIDFGAATFIGAMDGGNMLVTIVLDYMQRDWLRPPELHDDSLGSYTQFDTYYIGVLALEMITGILFLEKVGRDKTSYLKDVIYDRKIDASLAKFILKSTADEPRKRYRSVKALSRDFNRIRKKNGY